MMVDVATGLLAVEPFELQHTMARWVTEPELGIPVVREKVDNSEHGVTLASLLLFFAVAIHSRILDLAFEMGFE